MTIKETMQKWFTYVDGDMKQLHDAFVRFPVLQLLALSLRGVAQVVFVNNPITGAFLVLGLAFYNWFAGICCLLGAIIATLVAKYLKVEDNLINMGLFGYNGCLVGAVLVIFFQDPFTDGVDWEKMGTTLVILPFLCAYCPIITIFINRVMKLIGNPGLTLGYNIISVAFLLGTYFFGRTFPEPTIMYPHLMEPRVWNVTIDTTISPDGTGTTDFVDILNAYFRSIGQIMFADNLISGVLILIGIVVSSRLLAMCCILGTIVSLLTALALGVNGQAIYHGLWGYNGALGAMVIVTFCAITWHSIFLSLFCALMSTLATGFLKGFFSPLGVPVFTIPYNVVAYSFLVMKSMDDNKARLFSNELASSKVSPVVIQSAPAPQVPAETAIPVQPINDYIESILDTPGPLRRSGRKDEEDSDSRNMVIDIPD